MASLRSCRTCLEAASPRIGGSLSATACVLPPPPVSPLRPSPKMLRGSAARGGALVGARQSQNCSGRRHFHQSPTCRGPPEQAGATSGGGRVPSMGTSIRGALGGVLGKSNLMQSYQAFGVTKHMYEFCAKQADYKVSEAARKAGTLKKTEDGEEIGTGTSIWHTKFGLLPTFSTWSQVTMLYMYLYAVRMRCFEQEQFQQWQSQLVDHFFHDAETRMDLRHGVTSRAMRQRYLKDLFLTWRGLILAYDEGLVRGDAVLASAVWRNLYKGDEEVDVRHLAAVVGWVRLTLKELEKLEDADLVYAALHPFRVDASHELRHVDVPASQLRGLVPFKSSEIVSAEAAPTDDPGAEPPSQPQPSSTATAPTVDPKAEPPSQSSASST